MARRLTRELSRAAQHVAVVGGGDTAMEDALVLARTSASVTIIHRRDRFRASHALSSRVLAHPAIRVRWNATVVRFGGEPSAGLTHLMLQDAEGAARLDVGAAFVAIGHVPNTGPSAGIPTAAPLHVPAD